MSSRLYLFRSRHLAQDARPFRRHQDWTDRHPGGAYHVYFKDVVYRYEYERAVREGFLVDYDVVKVKSNVRMQGVFLKEGEEVAAVNPETGAKKMDILEDERQFDVPQVERDITSPDSNRKILEEIKKYARSTRNGMGGFPRRSFLPRTICRTRRMLTNWSTLPATFSAGR